MQTVLMHKYLVYNKTLRYTYSLFMMIVKQAALMNHRQIKGL